MKSDVNIIHFQWFKIPFFDFILLKLLKIFSSKTKIIFTAHNILPHDTGIKYEKIYNQIYRNIDRIIVHSITTKNELIQNFNISEQKVDIIPHGILSLKETVQYNKIKQPNSKMTFSFIGVISAYKGLDILIDAWCSDVEILNNPNIELIIAGAGSIPELSKIPNDKNIRVENYYHTEDELERIYLRTDVAILPYKKISQSGVLMTCMHKKVLLWFKMLGELYSLSNLESVVGYYVISLLREEIDNFEGV